MNKKSFLFIIIFLFITNFSNVFSTEKANNIYLKIKTINDNFNIQTIESLKKEFREEKGIYDKKIAYALLDIALEKKNDLSQEIVNLITEFYPQDTKQIATVIKKSFSLSALIDVVDTFTLVSSLKYLAFFIIILLLLYLFIKHWDKILHQHSEVKMIGFIKLAFFPLVYLTLIVNVPDYFFQISLFFIVLLLSFEVLINRIVVICFIFILSLVSSLSVKKRDVVIYPYDLAAAPVSTINNFSDDVIKNKIFLIKKGNLDFDLKAVSYQKNLKPDIVNYIVLNLMKNNFDKAFELIKRYRLDNDPNIIYNLAVYYFNNFEMDSYENTLFKLKGYPFYYKIFNDLQIQGISPYYLPYFEKFKEDRYFLSYKKNTIIYTLIVLVISLILSVFISRFSIFKCGECGEVFCVKCDDGYLHKNICEKCRKLQKYDTVADAHEIIKHRNKIASYQTNRKRLLLILSMILPGSANLLKDNILVSLLILILFSINLYIVLLRYQLIASVNNILFYYFYHPLFIALLAVFLIIYVINLLRV